VGFSNIRLVQICIARIVRATTRSSGQKKKLLNFAYEKKGNMAFGFLKCCTKEQKPIDPAENSAQENPALQEAPEMKLPPKEKLI